MMEQNLFIRRAAVTDAELLAETRRSAWDATYRGIYPDAWIDEYNLAEQTQRERARLEQTDYMAYLVMDGVVGEIDDGHENLAEDQMYFEFCTGEQI